MPRILITGSAGKLGLPGNQLPGLERVCELLALDVRPDHTALGDVHAAASCLIALGATPGDGNGS